MKRKAKDIQYCVNENGCWICTSHGRSKAGYPMKWKDDKQVYISHIMFEMYKGPISEGLCVCHKCDIPACINPDHLWLGTKGANIHDCVQKGRNNIGERNGIAVLTEQQIKEIRQMYGTQREIGFKFGIGQPHVSYD